MGPPSERKPAKNTKPPPPAWLLRRGDQAAVAVLVLASLVATIAWWISYGGLRGRMIEIDRAELQTIRYEVDINSAGWTELAQLPGIGATLAQRIVESRETRGPYLDHEDLRRVQGLGPRRLETIRPYLKPMADHKAMAGR
jgi:competence protein ComEA